MVGKFKKQALLAALAANLARLIFSTIRLRVTDRSGFLTNPPTGPRILVFWHNRIPAISIGFLRHYPAKHPSRKGVSVLTSPSKDGDILAGVMANLGMGSVRGSSSRRGSTAIRELSALPGGRCRPRHHPGRSSRSETLTRPRAVFLAQKQVFPSCRSMPATTGRSGSRHGTASPSPSPSRGSTLLSIPTFRSIRRVPIWKANAGGWKPICGRRRKRPISPHRGLPIRANSFKRQRSSHPESSRSPPDPKPTMQHAPSNTTTSASAHLEKDNIPLIILISVIAAIGGFLFGYDSGVINGTTEGLKQAFKSDSALTGFNVASALLGCAAGAFMAGSLADKFGRRPILIFSALLFAVSAGCRHLDLLSGVHHLSCARRPGSRRRQRPVPRLHQRSHSSPFPRSHVLGPAGCHYLGAFLLLPE